MTVYAGIQNTVTRFDEFVHKYDVGSNELVNAVQNCDETTVNEIINTMRGTGEDIESLEVIDDRRLRNTITENVNDNVTNDVIRSVLERRDKLYKVSQSKTGWVIEVLSKELLKDKVHK